MTFTFQCPATVISWSKGDELMRGLLLSISFLTSMTAVFLIQEHYSFIVGYTMAAIFVALHVVVAVSYLTSRGAR